MAEAEIGFNPFALNFNNAGAPPPMRKLGARGKDVGKQVTDNTWAGVQRVYEFEDGWYIGYLSEAEDMVTLGNLMGHCSGTHFIWTVEEKIWYFFALFDPGDVPHSTIHGKQASWMNKPHPRDKGEKWPIRVDTVNDYGYQSLDDVHRCFKAAGLEYEPGKYGPLHYDSCTYDYGARDAYGADRNSFRYAYGDPVICGRKPADVDSEIWEVYVQAAKAVEDNHDKNKGAVQVQGRRFKFDGKWLICLSASNKSQDGVGGSYGKKVAEWLNSTTRKGKK